MYEHGVKELRGMVVDLVKAIEIDTTVGGSFYDKVWYSANLNRGDAIMKFELMNRILRRSTLIWVSTSLERKACRSRVPFRPLLHPRCQRINSQHL